MQALLMTAHHELRLVDMPDPRVERPDDVLIAVRAAGICGSDLHGYTGRSGRRTPPLVMGHEATGDVVATGDQAAHLLPGTRVAIHPLDDTGTRRLLIGMDAPGTYAERVVWPSHRLVPLPDHLDYDVGALAEPLSVAVRAVDAARMDDTASALVVGAGTIGLLVASVLRHRGVPTVVITDLSDERLAVATDMRLGATVNPGRDAVTATVSALTHGEGVDVAFEAVGTAATVAQAHAATKRGGTIVWIGNNHKQIELDMQEVVTRELTVRGTYGMSDADFTAAIAILATGAIDAERLISRRATLAEGPQLFDELLASPGVIKCIFEIS